VSLGSFPGAAVHHSGKKAAAGSRGWSGVRCAGDTEIEVKDFPAGKRCEITKQRDLGNKCERIGFRLDPVTLRNTVSECRTHLDATVIATVGVVSG